MPEVASRLKVCHVFAGTEGGRWVYEQLEALKNEHGCDVFAVLGGDQGPTVELCRNAGIPVKAFDFRLGLKSLLSIPLRIVRLAHWMRKQRFDVVQSHVLSSTLFARPAAWLADVPVRLVMVTGPYYMLSPGFRGVEKATVGMETGVIPSCDLTGQLYRDAGVAERLIFPTLYYGPRADCWNPERTTPAGIRAELGLPPDTPLIGSVALFYPRSGASSFSPPETHNKHLKGHVELIQAMPAVLETFPNAKLLLIGRGWGAKGALAEKELREFVRAEGLEDSVIFTGYRSDVAAIYMDLDVSVQASLNDNLGGTIETLLMERPIVATRVGGLVDSVIDGETGILVNPGDPADLAGGILRILNDPAAGRRMAKAGRARMLSRFTLSTTASGLADLYSRQRQRVRHAWRPHVGLARLLLLPLAQGPAIVRLLLVDFCLFRLKRKLK